MSLFLLLGTRYLTMPGPQPDELLQAIPAAKLLNTDRARYGSTIGSSIEWMGRQWPVMAMPYLGALKSYLLVPPFALFGVSVSVLRATTLATGAVAIGLAFVFTRRFYDWRVATLAAFLLATDPASRTDWGPIALGTTLRCLTGLAILHWMFRRSIWSSGLVGLCLGIAVYEKAHALAFVAAIAGVFVLALILRRERPRAAETLTMGAGFFIGAAPFLIWNMLNGWPILSAARASPDTGTGGSAALGAGIGQVPERLIALLVLIQGGLLDGYVYGTPVSPWIGNLRTTGLALTILPIALLCFSRFRAPRIQRDLTRTVLLALMLLITATIILVSPIPVSVHHLIIVAPMLQILVAWVYVRAWDSALYASKVGAGLRGALACLVGIVLGSNLAVYGRYTELMAAGVGGPAWHPAVYTLASTIDKTYRDSVVEGMDWGLDMQLLFLTEGRARVNPLWAVMGRENENLEDKLRQSRYIFVSRAPGTEIDGVAARRYRDYLAATGRTPCERRVINDEDGLARYEILMFRGCR
jgi:4-amino-4-deoxy-L-arabinose transferase-like glycosyltransferase